MNEMVKAASAETSALGEILEAPVRAVTVLEDRAQITRRATVALGAGSHRLRVLAVAPVISDKSVVVRAAGDTLRVDEARVERQWRIGSAEQPPDTAALAEEGERLGVEIRRHERHHGALQWQRTQLHQAVDLLVQGVNAELPYARDFEPAWGSELESFLGTMRSLDERVTKLEEDTETLRGKAAALALRAETTLRPDHLLACELIIEVTVRAPGTHELSIEYLVPCALWRPMHRAMLGSTDQVHFATDAALWQMTGEDWHDVSLSFSTARSTQRAEPPVLYDDRLMVQRKQDKRIQVGVREQAIATTGEGMAASTVSELPGVDDGGETRLMAAPTAATVMSDGRMVRVPLFAFTADAEIDRIARPERSSLAHLRSKQANLAQFPLLAGPVELLRQSGYVGRSKIGFVAPQEQFLLGWGGEDALRITRRTNEWRETTKITGKQTITREVTLFLSNLDDEPGVFRLEERIPVSEIEQVSVDIDVKETFPASKVNDQGMVGWDIRLPPHATQLIKLTYRLVASSDVRGL